MTYYCNFMGWNRKLTYVCDLQREIHIPRHNLLLAFHATWKISLHVISQSKCLWFLKIKRDCIVRTCGFSKKQPFGFKCEITYWQWVHHIEVKCKLSRTIILVIARLNIKALQNFLKIQECDWNIAVQIISAWTFSWPYWLVTHWYKVRFNWSVVNKAKQVTFLLS